MKSDSAMLESLKPGDTFSYITDDVMAATATHKVKAHKPEQGLTEIYCFCDAAVTTHRNSSTVVRVR